MYCSMMTAKLLHISDSFVGEQQTSDAESNLGGVDLAVDKAVDMAVDAVVHTGNLFRRHNPNESVVDAVADAISDLDAADIPFYIIEGPREAHAGSNAITLLEERSAAHRLSSDPEIVDNTALYGIDHVGDEEKFRTRLAELTPADEFTCNVVCVNQPVWPPVHKETADISAFDIMDTTDLYLGAVLAGGNDKTRQWESDDFEYHVTYPGPTNPAKRETGNPIKGWLITADPDDRQCKPVPLAESETQQELSQLEQILEATPSDINDVDIETLADLYGLTAKARGKLEQRRKELRNELLARVETNQQIEGNHASVKRTTRRQRTLKSEDTVREKAKADGIEPTSLMSLDASALREHVEQGRLEENDIFEIETKEYVRLDDIL